MLQYGVIRNIPYKIQKTNRKVNQKRYARTAFFILSNITRGYRRLLSLFAERDGSYALLLLERLEKENVVLIPAHFSYLACAEVSFLQKLFCVGDTL